MLYVQTFQTLIIIITTCKPMEILSIHMLLHHKLLTFSTISSSCGCGFTSDHITDSVFLCSSCSSNSVNYQAQLHGIPQANVSQLIITIREEIIKGKMSIKVQFSLLTIQKVCIVPYGTERPCDDVSSTGTEVIANNTCPSCVGIITGITTTLIIIILV